MEIHSWIGLGCGGIENLILDGTEMWRLQILAEHPHICSDPSDSSLGSQGPAPPGLSMVIYSKSTVEPAQTRGSQTQIAERGSGCEQAAGPCSALNPPRPFFSQLIFISSGSVTSNKRSVLSNHALPSSCHPLSTQSPARLLSPHSSPRALEKSFSARLYSHITRSYSSPGCAALPLGLPLTIPSSGTLQIQSDSSAPDVFVSVQKAKQGGNGDLWDYL